MGEEEYCIDIKYVQKDFDNTMIINDTGAPESMIIVLSKSFCTYFISMQYSSSTYCVLMVTFLSISSIFFIPPTLCFIVLNSFSIPSTFFTRSLFGFSADFSLFPVLLPGLLPLFLDWLLIRLVSLYGLKLPYWLELLFGLELLLLPNLELSL